MNSSFINYRPGQGISKCLNIIEIGVISLIYIFLSIFIVYRSEELLECVHTQVGSCTTSQELAMLTNAQWFYERIKSAGACGADTDISRTCNPSAALACISELGTTLTTQEHMDKVACR